MMPGPVSDSYDPEFGTGENAEALRTAIRVTKQKVTAVIGSDQLLNIMEIVRGKDGRLSAGPLTERQWRIIRFCLNRALESI